MTTHGFSAHAGLWDWRNFTEQVLYCTRQARTPQPREKAIYASGTQAIKSEVYSVSWADFYLMLAEWKVQYNDRVDRYFYMGGLIVHVFNY